MKHWNALNITNKNDFCLDVKNERRLNVKQFIYTAQAVGH